jgi:hypothetical protein
VAAGKVVKAADNAKQDRDKCPSVGRSLPNNSSATRKSLACWDSLKPKRRLFVRKAVKDRQVQVKDNPDRGKAEPP